MKPFTYIPYPTGWPAKSIRIVAKVADVAWFARNRFATIIKTHNNQARNYIKVTDNSLSVRMKHELQHNGAITDYYPTKKLSVITVQDNVSKY